MGVCMTGVSQEPLELGRGRRMDAREGEGEENGIWKAREEKGVWE